MLILQGMSYCPLNCLDGKTEAKFLSKFSEDSFLKPEFWLKWGIANYKVKEN